MVDAYNERIDILDYARFFAAMLVMGFHLFFLGVNRSFGYSDGWSQIFQFGHVGVELFFMISGYVIFYSSRHSTAAHFISARVLRLYPAFLTALLLTTAVIYFLGTASELISPTSLLKNLTMFPTAFGDKDVDPSYWTLRLEIWFYAIVSVFIITDSSKNLRQFYLIWPVAIVIAQFTPLHAAPLLNAPFIFFAAGTLFALERARSSWLTRLLLGVCYIQSLHGAGVLTTLAQTSGKVILLAITCFYIFFIILNKPSVMRRKLPAARLLGAVTYPVYLVHQVIGFMIMRAFATPENKVAVTLGTMGSMLILAYVLHRLVEVKGKAVSKRVIRHLVGTPVAYAEQLFRRRNGVQGQTSS